MTLQMRTADGATTTGTTTGTTITEAPARTTGATIITGEDTVSRTTETTLEDTAPPTMTPAIMVAALQSQTATITTTITAALEVRYISTMDPLDCEGGTAGTILRVPFCLGLVVESMCQGSFAIAVCVPVWLQHGSQAASSV